jgi:O-antigen/teichoic acid export membrane protein
MVNAYSSVKQYVQKFRSGASLQGAHPAARAAQIWNALRGKDGASSLLFRNSIALILARVSQSGLGFFAWLIAARLYTQSEVGLASGVVSAMMLCVQVALLGIGAAFIKLYPQYQDRPIDILHTALTVVSAMSLVWAGVFLLVASAAFHELSVVGSMVSYTALFLGLTLFGALQVLLDHISIALRRGHQVLVRNTLIGLITVAGVAAMPLVFNAKSSMAIIAAWVLANLAAVSIGIVQLWLSVSHYRYQPRVNHSVTRELFRIGIPNWALTITERAPAWLMPIAVTELLSPTDNAHWYAVWMMAWVILIIPISVGQNLFAEVSHHPSALQKTTRQSIRSSLTLGSAAMIGVMVMAPFVLSLLGRDYARAGTTPLRILSLSLWPVTYIQIYYNACRARHRLGEATWVGLLNAVLSTVIPVAAGVAYGLTGMAAAWVAVQFATSAWTMWRMRTLTRSADGLRSSLSVEQMPSPDQEGATES